MRRSGLWKLRGIPPMDNYLFYGIPIFCHMNEKERKKKCKHPCQLPIQGNARVRMNENSTKEHNQNIGSSKKISRIYKFFDCCWWYNYQQYILRLMRILFDFTFNCIESRSTCERVRWESKIKQSICGGVARSLFALKQITQSHYSICGQFIRITCGFRLQFLRAPSGVCPVDSWDPPK